jgi:hypothetical protein
MQEVKKKGQPAEQPKEITLQIERVTRKALLMTKMMTTIAELIRALASFASIRVRSREKVLPLTSVPFLLLAFTPGLT